MRSMAGATKPNRGALLARLHHSGDQKVTFVELFFDLVFVFAITQVTKYVVDDLSWDGAAEALLLFWMIWWAWTQFTWALNPADTTHGAVRIVTLVATAVGFLIAVNVPGAYDESGLWFAVPYVVVRLLGLGIYTAAAAGEGQRRAVRAFAAWSIVPMMLVIVGGLLETPARAWVWLAAVLLDIVAAGQAGRLEGWDLRPGHFAERHGLFVIIALGESLIVAGQSVLATESSSLLITVALGAVAVTCLMWWLYFGWWQEAIEDQLAMRRGQARTAFARDVYSFLHFVVIAGVIAIAAGIEEMVLHPDEPLPPVVRVALAAGLVLYLGATDAGWWRATGRLLPGRTIVGIILAIAVAILELPALPEIGVVATGLALVTIIEVIRRPAHSVSETAELVDQAGTSSSRAVRPQDG